MSLRIMAEDQRYAELKAEYDAFRECTEETDKEHALALKDLEGRLETLTRLNQNLSTENDLLKRSLRSKNDELLANQQSLADQIRSVDEFRARNADLSSQLRGMENEIEKRDRLLREADFRVQSLQAELDSCSDLLIEIRSSRDELKDEVDALKAESMSQQRDSSHCSNLLEKDIGQLISEIQRLLPT